MSAKVLAASLIMPLAGRLAVLHLPQIALATAASKTHGESIVRDAG